MTRLLTLCSSLAVLSLLTGPALANGCHRYAPQQAAVGCVQQPTQVLPQQAVAQAPCPCQQQQQQQVYVQPQQVLPQQQVYVQQQPTQVLPQQAVAPSYGCNGGGAQQVLYVQQQPQAQVLAQTQVLPQTQVLAQTQVLPQQSYVMGQQSLVNTSVAGYQPTTVLASTGQNYLTGGTTVLAATGSVPVYGTGGQTVLVNTQHQRHGILPHIFHRHQGGTTVLAATGAVGGVCAPVAGVLPAGVLSAGGGQTVIINRGRRGFLGR